MQRLIANPFAPSGMVRLTPLELTGRGATHVQVSENSTCALHPLARRAFDCMAATALQEGIELAAISCFRSFTQQLAIWNGKFAGERVLLSRAGAALDALALSESARVDAILVWSALPGASRHHWGTDFDVIDRAALPAGERVQLVPAEYATGGWFAPLDRWLERNAADFGFYRPYDIDRGGVLPEPWHLSFAPLASLALQDLGIDVLADSLAGMELAGRDIVFSRLPELHQRYVLGVAEPTPAALAAAALSDAARPS
jgi:LAS superfamily LD-carboxypeptidase LdcB